MQVVVWLKDFEEREERAPASRRLLRKVSGIPLLVRTLATAFRTGASQALVVYPENLEEDLLRRTVESSVLGDLKIQFRKVDLDAREAAPEQWRKIESELHDRFLWLPWNFVTLKKTLRSLLQADLKGADGAWLIPVGEEQPPEPPQTSPPVSLDHPVLVEKQALFEKAGGDFARYLREGSFTPVPVPSPIGVTVDSRSSVRAAEDLLVRGSGKPGDGFYSKFNRRMTWPVLRPLLRTPVTANMVTWAGLPVAALSGWFYAQGGYLNFVLGGVAYFVAVLIDEMDGMIARTKFQESAFGCWLETFSDYLSYLFLWAGITIGLYRDSSNPIWLYLGALTFLGGITTFLVLVRLRKVSAPPDKPEQHLQNFYSGLEKDSENWVSRVTRKVQFVMKKGVMCHYLLLFSLLKIIKVFFLITVFGVNIAWILGLYFTRRLFSTPVRDEQS